MTKHTEASAEVEELSNDELFESWLTEKRNELESIDVESLCRMVRLATRREGQSALLTEQEKVRELEIENNQLNAHLSRIGLIVDDVDYLGEHSVGVQILKDKVADLTAKVAELEGIANSDDGAGGEGMRLYLENKDMTKKIADLTARLEAQGASDHVKIQSIHMLMAEGYSVPLQILDTSLCPTGLQINVASSTKQEASEPVAENGKWSIGKTDDGRYFAESDDFTHDVRLYLDGDFGSGEQRYHYLGEIISRLNLQQPAKQEASEPVGSFDRCKHHVCDEDDDHSPECTDWGAHRQNEESEPVVFTYCGRDKLSGDWEISDYPSEAWDQIIPLYTAPQPTPTVKAAVAAALRRAAEACRSYYSVEGIAQRCEAEIIALPRDDSALMEFGVKVAREFVDPATSDARLEAIVNRKMESER